MVNNVVTVLIDKQYGRMESLFDEAFIVKLGGEIHIVTASVVGKENRLFTGIFNQNCNQN